MSQDQDLLFLNKINLKARIEIVASFGETIF